MLHWAPELHLTLQPSPHDTSQADTLVQLALQPVAPAAHWSEQLAPPEHPHDVSVHAHVAPVQVGMVDVPPLHATTVEPTAPARTSVEKRRRDQERAFIREPPTVQWVPGTPGLPESSRHGSQATAERQRAGDPVHEPPQQSPGPLQSRPSARHVDVDVHTGIPCAFARQLPRQQSTSIMHGELGSRQGPGPRSQREVTGLQVPEQQSPPTAQDEPVRPHDVCSAAQTRLSHLLEQQSVSCAHAVPTTAHTVATHVSLVAHPREQQSSGLEQG